MAGNVWEWCADWYDNNYYANSPKRNPKGPSAGEERVIRGAGNLQWTYGIGAFVISNDCSLVSNRYFNDPSRADIFFGFRCVQDVPK